MGSRLSLLQVAHAGSCSIAFSHLALQGLPASRLHAASGADAIVAWNASSLTGIVVWLSSEDKIDWLQDAITFFSGGQPVVSLCRPHSM